MKNWLATLKHSTCLQALLFVLLTVLAQGMTRIALVPLWGHYDEPSHYEYMQYLVKHRSLPSKPPDQDLATRIAESFDAVVATDCVNVPPEQHCFIPGMQYSEVPGYYTLLAVFQWIFQPVTIRRQVMIARMISVLLAILTAWMAYLTVKVTLPERPLLALGTTLLMGVIIGYVDLMSALSNDVGAIAAVSLMILAVSHLLQHGLKWRTVLLIVTAAVFCLLAKSSSWIGILMAFMGLGMYLWRKSGWPLRATFLVVSAGVILWGIKWEPGVGPLLNPTINQYFPWGGANARLPSWYDLQNWPYYFRALRWQFVTFWASFAQGIAALPRWGIGLFALLSGFAALGLVYVAFTSYRSYSKSQQQILLFHLFAVGATLLMSFVRIDPPGGYIPTARHFYIAIVPSTLLFLLGLGAWLPRSWRHYGLGLLVLMLYGMGVWSTLNVQIPWFIANWPVGY